MAKDTEFDANDNSNVAKESHLCDSPEEFDSLQNEFGVAARWIRPKKEGEPPQWESLWRWKPEDGLGWPKHGTDCY